MNDHDWHLDDTTVRRYGEGALAFAAAASVDAHLTQCPQCQALVGRVWAPPALDRVKVALDRTLDVPPESVVERTLRRVGLGVLDAKVVSASLALEGSWVVAALLAVAFALAAADAVAGGTSAAAFLVLSPLVPLAGVGLTFGPHVDPTYEIAIASPVPAVRIILLRTAAVAASTLPVLVILSTLLPDLPTSPLVWALPAIGLASASLALGTVMPITRAALGVAGLWLLGSAVRLSGAAGASEFIDLFPAFQPPGQLLFAALAAVSTLTVLARRTSFEVAR